jgi:hypothetical protein
MTPSEKWVLGLFAVYSLPAFLMGVGATLLFVRLKAVPRFLSPEIIFDPETSGLAPADNSHGLLSPPIKLP